MKHFEKESEFIEFIERYCDRFGINDVDKVKEKITLGKPFEIDGFVFYHKPEDDDTPTDPHGLRKMNKFCDQFEDEDTRFHIFYIVNDWWCMKLINKLNIGMTIMNIITAYKTLYPNHNFDNVKLPQN